MGNDKKFRALAIAAICVAIVGVSVAYAALSASLSISGVGTVDTASSWKVYFSDVSSATATGGAKVTTAPALKASSTTNVEWAATFSAPGDSVSFTVTLKNEGSIDAVLTAINNAVNGDAAENFTHEITIGSTSIPAGETLPVTNRLLNSDDTKVINVKVTFDKDAKLNADQLANLNTKTANFTLSLSFGQASSSDKTTYSAL